MTHYKNNVSEINPKELRNQYEQLKEMALRDTLTGLYNRGAFETQVNERLQAMETGESCALFLMDLDNFKAVNDTLGHQAGDEVLIMVSQTLKDMFRKTDLVGRLGGDEFLVFLSGKITEEGVRAKGQMLCDQLQYAMGVGDHIVVTASVGIYWENTATDSFETMYRSADLALYKAKRRGKQTYCVQRQLQKTNAADVREAHPLNVVNIRSLLDYIDSGVAMIELKEDMQILYGSPAFAKMLGVESGELAKKALLGFVHPEEKEQLLKLFQKRVMEGNETVCHVTRIIAADDTTHWWRIYGVRVDGNEERSVALITVTDISDLKEQEESLKKENELFQMAMNQTAQAIWEVDLETKCFRLIGENTGFVANVEEPCVFPEGLIEQKWVHEESAEGFCDFAAELFGGKLQGYANFKIKYQKPDTYCWASFSCRTVSDEEGVPVRIVGVLESIAPETTGQEPGAKGMALPESLKESLLVQMHGNLTEDVTYDCWIEGKNRTKDGAYQRCSQLLEEGAKKVYAPGENTGIAGALSRNSLLIAYLERNSRWMSYEYRRKNEDHTTSWVSCVINLYRKSKGDNVYVSIWISKLDMRRRWESRYPIKIFKDPISKLYASTTVREIASRMIEQRKHEKCALAMVEIGGMARLYAQYSQNLDSRWQAIITSLMLAMGANCLPGQYGTDRYLFFFPQIAQEQILKRKIEQAFWFVRTVTADIIEGSLIRLTAAVVCRYQDATTYDFLISKAQKLCMDWGNTSGDRVVFWDEISHEQNPLKNTEVIDRFHVQKEEAMRPLSEREQEVAFRCVMEMLGAESLEQSSHCVLKTLGEYFEADRAYILILAENGQIVTMPHEWTAADKHSIQQAVTGMLVERLPVLQRCMKHDRPVFLTRRKKGESEGKEIEILWRFAIFPMREEGKVLSYLCIENGATLMSDAVLPTLLSSCLLRERRKHMRVSGAGFANEGRGSRFNLPNNSEYLEVIYHYNSDSYQSLGTVVVDIPNYSSINGQRGFAYGRKLLWFVIQTLTDIFGKSMLYRTWDAEFVVLCPNMSHQVFLGKCASLRSLFTRNYPHEIRMGRTWSDKIFEGKALVDEARVLMKCNEVTRENISGLKLPAPLASFDNVAEMIRADRFTVYYQPKVHMKTGELVGAEALVRGLDEAGRPIPPIKFIDELEEKGSIRDLDLFVLDRVMRSLHQWKAMGVPLVPVSVNFSRKTLFDPRILASVLAILSRYPEVPAGMIEIEITESAGDISQETLKNVMSDFRQYGLGFGLDDFGSKYSNLAVFTNVPFETVKLDRSLVTEIAFNESNRVLVKDIVKICNQAKVPCIAEGVETMEQVDVLLEMGCLLAQGYYYDRPMPEEKFHEKYHVRRGSKID